MGDPIKLGIIGGGLAVKLLHWPALQRLRDKYEFVAVADVDPARAQATAEMIGADRTFTDYHDLLALSAIEAVLLALPIHLTAPITLDAARAGKHVLLEKPPATNLEQAQELKEQLACQPVTILVAENFRYRPDLLAIERIVREGGIGELVLIRLHALMKANTSDPNSFGSTPWRHDPQYRGGQMLDGGVHHAAALRSIGGEVEWVQAFTKSGGSQLNGPTTMTMNLRFRSGALASYVHSAVVQDEQPSFLGLSVYGTTGTIRLQDRKLEIIRPGQATERVDVDTSDGGYYGEFLNFYEAVHEGKPVIATVEESYKDMELILRGIDSAEQADVILL